MPVSRDDAATPDLTAHLARLVEPAGWAVTAAPDGMWARTAPPAPVPLPPQGWKLHVTATDATALATLDAAVPVLLDAAATFKIAASRRALAVLNEGRGGPSQVGKFMTVYPATDAHAVHLAARLDAALGDLGGPRVPSDRALRDGGAVSYRYGGFAGRWIQLVSGEYVPAIVGPDGGLVADARRAADAAPPWLVDPFEAAGLVQAPEPVAPLLADRFRIVATLARSPRGSVHLAADLADLRRVVIKRADAAAAEHAARLRHEHEALRAVAGLPGTTQVAAWIETADELILAVEDVPGRTFSSALDLAATDGFRSRARTFVPLAAEVAKVVAGMHERGIVHRDLKPTNVLVESDGTVRVIDLELAGLPGDAGLHGFGTVGYVSPEQARHEAPDPADDVYSLGALLVGAAIGTDPSNVPHTIVTDRLDDVVPDLPADVSSVIRRCLAPTRAERPADAGALVRELLAADLTERAVPAYGDVPNHVRRDPAHARELVGRLADAIVADRVEVDGERTWVSRHPASPGMPVRDVNTGVAGTVLGLLALAEATGAAEHAAAVADGARWLAAAARPEGRLVTGLYVGEMGVAVALGAAGLALDEPAWVDEARRRSAEIAGLPHVAPDVFNGSAGRARGHLWLARRLGDEEVLAAARAAAHDLLQRAERPEPGQLLWRLPAELGGELQLGYAHGAAGIADVLLEVGLATDDPALRDAAAEVGRMLVTEAIAIEPGVGAPVADLAVAWPSVPGGRPWMPLWCHGAVGIGRFLLHLDRAGLLADEGRWLVRASGVAAARLGRSLGPVLCHGLAGSIDHLLDLYASDGDNAHLAEAHLAEAWWLATLLEEHHLEGGGAHPDHHLRISSEQVGVATPDLTVGYAGAATVWRRLADPTRPGVPGLTAPATDLM